MHEHQLSFGGDPVRFSAPGADSTNPRFSADGKQLASSGRDETLAIHDVATQKQIAKMDSQGSIVAAVVADPLVLRTLPEREYRVFGAQATGCNPVSVAFAEGTDVVRPVKPDTIAKSLAIGTPAEIKSNPAVIEAYLGAG